MSSPSHWDEKRQALVDYLNDLYEHDPQYQKQHLIDMQIALALLQLYDGPIHQLSDTNIYNEEFLIALCFPRRKSSTRYRIPKFT